MGSACLVMRTKFGREPEVTGGDNQALRFLQIFSWAKIMIQDFGKSKMLFSH